MKAIALLPGTTNVFLTDIPEPAIAQPDEIKMRVLQVGICGTDREEAAGGRAEAPAGEKQLVLGHEMIGQVVETGKDVTRVKPGDFAVFTVRRGCSHCLPCTMNRSDMCRTGEYTERGIWGRNGYDTEFVVDREQYVVHIPGELAAIGVLTEPTSVVEKAIDESVRIQLSRLPGGLATPDWLYGKRCLVAGLGPIGLLGAMILRLRGAEVYGMDVVDANTNRPQWLEKIGGKYVDGRKVPADKVADTLGAMDMIVEATGVAALEFNLIDALALNGIYVLTGIPGGDRPLQLPGAQLLRQLVLDNQVMFGSVNAAQGYFQMGVDDLMSAKARWGDHISQLITQRYPYTDFQKAFTQHAADEIKVVLEWSKPT